MLTHIQPERTAAPAQPPVASGASENCDAYFFGIRPLLEPIQLNPPAASVNLESDYAELTQVTSGLQQLAKELAEFSQEHAVLADQLASARTTHCLVSHGVVPPPGKVALSHVTVEQSALAESQVIASQEGLRHSLREIIPVMQRRLDLGLALALANLGDSGRPEISAARVAELASELNQSAEIYRRRQELAEALVVLDNL